MATNYTCDRCGVELKNRDDDKGGAHRLKIEDVIPWTEGSTHSAPQLGSVDLCGGCCAGFRKYLEPIPKTG